VAVEATKRAFDSGVWSGPLFLHFAELAASYRFEESIVVTQSLDRHIFDILLSEPPSA
jgi:hypothetical protein